MARDERAEREAAVQRIVRGFDARAVDETPFRPAEFLILSMIVRSAYDKYTNVMGIRPDNLWWVALIEARRPSICSSGIRTASLLGAACRYAATRCSYLSAKRKGCGTRELT
jgi:hypothetical protein